jgi:competence protein ComEA
LGGYVSEDQLLDVYGMDRDLLNSLLLYAFIDSSKISLIDINFCSVWELIKHPYINEMHARDIIKYREISGEIKKLDELVENGIINDSLFLKISPYISCGRSNENRIK